MTAIAGRWSRTTVVLMLLAVVGLGLGWSSKAACVSTYDAGGGTQALDWRDWRQYSDHCYSDIVPLYGIEGLQDDKLPYKYGWPDGEQTRHMEYPVLTGFLQYGAMKITKQVVKVTEEDPAQPKRPEVVVYFTVMALVLSLAWLLAVFWTIPLASRKRDIALIALSPLVAVHAFTNFDLFSVSLAAAGMLAWARQRPMLAGVLIGLGAAAKLYPIFILGPLLVLCLRSDRMRAYWDTFTTAAAAWLAVNLPIALLYPEGWWEFFRLNSTRGADPDSIYNVISVFTGWSGFDGPLGPGQSPEKLNLYSLGLFLLVCLAIGIVGLTAPQRPRVASLVFLIVAAFLITNKVWSPQYSLWLVPLAVLAYPRWIPLLLWMGVDAYVWWPRMGWYLGMSVPDQGNSQEVFVRTVLARDVMVLIICALVVWTIYRPDRDPVRRAGFDDPAGGPLDGTPRERRRWRDMHPLGEPYPPADDARAEDAETESETESEAETAPAGAAAETSSEDSSEGSSTAAVPPEDSSSEVVR
jgi:uncharacterized membrane protein